MYLEAPDLIYHVEEKELSIADLLKCDTKDAAVDQIIERDISSLLRSSYVEQFKKLEKRHGLSTLRKFENWPKFVEAAQRRNLITHCNGIINNQYLRCCEEAGCKIGEAKAGTKISVDEAYLNAALDLIYEVGVKLTHTLWRKSAESHKQQSEEMMTREVFELLKRDEVGLARTIGQFALELPRPASDLQQRITRINYAQALKWSGDDAKAKQTLNALDWSSSIRDLRLGVEVLRENFDAAADLMRDIGEIGELVLESGYREWPVFREFRESDQFKSAFKEVYGAEFITIDNTADTSSNADQPKSRSRKRTKKKSPKRKTGAKKMPPKQPPIPKRSVRKNKTK